MPATDLRSFLSLLEKYGELRVIHGASCNLEIGAITELSLQNDGPALLFNQIPGYSPGYGVAVNICSTLRRGLLAFDLDPELSEEEALKILRKRWDNYKPIPPRFVDGGPMLENVQTGDEVNLLQFPVPIWHELDGGAYIGTGHAIIQQDPDTKLVNVGTYRMQLHDARTTGLFQEPESDGAKIREKFWAQGKPCPIAVSLGPEPQLFLSGCSGNGAPRGMHEYEFTGYLCGEPIPVIRGSVTGLPIPANSEIAIEGEIPPPSEEARTEGPFGEWTGYYEAAPTPEPVIRVKALYYRTNPILFGAPPLQHRTSYSLAFDARTAASISHYDELGLAVQRVTSLVPFGCTVISIKQQHPDDVTRLMDAVEKAYNPSRLTIIVDDDVNPNDPWDVLWAVGSRFDPEQTRMSVVESKWLLNPLRTIEHRIARDAEPYKRMIINGCRPFDRLGDFPPVNTLSSERRQETWGRWQMAGWLPPGSSPVVNPMTIR